MMSMFSTLATDRRTRPPNERARWTNAAVLRANARRRGLWALAVAVLWAGLAVPAHAEVLQCSGGSVSEGDALVTLSHRCGPPAAQASRCEPLPAPPPARMMQGPHGPVWPAPLLNLEGSGACIQVDEWLYDRGPGHLPALVRLRGGQIQAIQYGRGG